MMNHRIALLAGAAFVGVASFTIEAQAQARAGGSAAALSFPPKPIADEYLLLGDATRGSGEAQIVVNPTDPDNIFVIGMGTLQFRPGCPVPDVQCESGQNVPKPPFSTLPSSAVTHDGGRTWKHFDLPILEGGYVRCPDPFVGATKDGTLLAGCEPVARQGQYAIETPQPMPLAKGETAVVVSTDKGETWSKRTDGINNYGKPPYPTFAPGLKPSFAGTSPWDRPWLSFDDKTGTVYLSSFGGLTDIDTGKPGQFRQQSYFTVSHDGGRSFGAIRAFDTLDWPQGARAASNAASNGEFAEAYVASKLPASEHATCPCQVFGISTDEGMTFKRHVMKNIVLAPPGSPSAGAGSLGGGDGTALIADPTTPGRYTIFRYVAKPVPHHEFVTSNDHGQTWSDFVSVASVSGASSYTKAAVKYSRWGVLGLVWKAIYPDGTFEQWSAISRDGGRSFSAPLRISAARSVPRPYYRAVDRDDNDGLDMSQTDLFAIWGDSRAGFQGSWFGKVALASYH